ncbi:MAG: GNAT family protein [Bauldia sp.]
MNINLRPARPADAEEMARWFVDLTELAQWGGPEVRFPLTDDQLAAWIGEGAKARPRTCFTAPDGTDKPIGHVQFLHDRARLWVRIGRFGVAPARRGAGFGAALFDEAVRIAFAEMEAETVELGVLTTNDRARRLYLRAGFRDESAAMGSWVVDGRAYAMSTMGLTRPEWLRLGRPTQGAARVA